ncbi:MAG: glycosyltransferase family 4 protein [Planctomycetaceae bacterium]|nr:glycosyltransferase family 4 protein [Planctomycetaceae bacterium]
MAASLRPRIAVLMEFPSALGGERSLLAVADNLRRECDFLILAPRGGSLEGEVASLGLTHLPFAFRDAQGNRFPDDVLFPRLEALLREHHCDLLHANSLTLCRFAGRHRERISIPVTGHLRDIMRLSAKAMGDLTRLDRLIAVSRATAEAYFDQGYPRGGITVIHNGIDCDSYLSPPRFTLRRELQLPPECRVAVVIGQIGLRKGHDTLLEALSTVAPSLPEWHFLILGERFSNKAESHEFIEQLDQISARAGLEPRIHWLGYMNDVPSVLAQADLLIHPARQEPFGRVLLEAAAAGVAILATDVGGTTELLKHGETAWLVPPNDVARLAAACQEVMQNQALRETLGSSARDHVKRNFTLEESSQAHLKIWRACLSSAGV